jgi:hypothetical protein
MQYSIVNEEKEHAKKLEMQARESGEKATPIRRRINKSLGTVASRANEEESCWGPRRSPMRDTKSPPQSPPANERTNDPRVGWRAVPYVPRFPAAVAGPPSRGRRRRRPYPLPRGRWRCCRARRASWAARAPRRPPWFPPLPLPLPRRRRRASRGAWRWRRTRGAMRRRRWTS